MFNLSDGSNTSKHRKLRFTHIRRKQLLKLNRIQLIGLNLLQIFRNPEEHTSKHALLLQLNGTLHACRRHDDTYGLWRSALRDDVSMHCVDGGTDSLADLIFELRCSTGEKKLDCFLAMLCYIDNIMVWIFSQFLSNLLLNSNLCCVEVRVSLSMKNNSITRLFLVRISFVLTYFERTYSRYKLLLL